ncbi:MAG: thiamine phosphate synthase [Victivallales bacterium]|nr:thiamine phosphate synthase [Victivallales bacterium]
MDNELFITNRHLCQGDFLETLERLAALRPRGLILREKDLTEAEYLSLAKQAVAICARHGTSCILHAHTRVALDLGHPFIHLPMPVLRNLQERHRRWFRVLGGSCHSVEEAREAASLGCTYLAAGHIFPTECKPGVPARGVEFLRQVCQAVKVPVYALGGVTPENRPLVMAAGAAGTAVMSGALRYLSDD